MNSELQLFNETNNVKNYCSLKPNTPEEKLALFNALELCDFKINDEVGKEIRVKNVFFEERDGFDKKTGEPRKNRRTILFDDENKTHVTASSYFFFTMGKILNVFGTPDTWEEPIIIKIQKREIKGSQGAALTAKIVNVKKEEVKVQTNGTITN